MNVSMDTKRKASRVADVSEKIVPLFAVCGVIGLGAPMRQCDDKVLYLGKQGKSSSPLAIRLAFENQTSERKDCHFPHFPSPRYLKSGQIGKHSPGISSPPPISIIINSNSE